ncbi:MULTISPECIES: hypothetical protein [unclassified Lysobacter]|uniref:hypothetical protein n=1 Tax=unclassified Lysobacter TaxID=2635362 RepID=UPI000AB007F0|nr:MULTISPECIES: hypothetical protein [unclassified Lysobacter]
MKELDRKQLDAVAGGVITDPATGGTCTDPRPPFPFPRPQPSPWPPTQPGPVYAL